ncbi:MAG: rod shape-determining protein RodA, partial [Maribacter sp.]
MSGKSLLKRIDWLTIFIYIALVVIGCVNIYSSTFTDAEQSILNFSTLYGKQLFFFGVSILAVIVIMALEASFYERFSSLLYIVSMV